MIRPYTHVSDLIADCQFFGNHAITWVFCIVWGIIGWLLHPELSDQDQKIYLQKGIHTISCEYHAPSTRSVASYEYTISGADIHTKERWVILQDDGYQNFPCHAKFTDAILIQDRSLFFPRYYLLQGMHTPESVLVNIENGVIDPVLIKKDEVVMQASIERINQDIRFEFMVMFALGCLGWAIFTGVCIGLGFSLGKKL